MIREKTRSHREKLFSVLDENFFLIRLQIGLQIEYLIYSDRMKTKTKMRMFYKIIGSFQLFSFVFLIIRKGIRTISVFPIETNSHPMTLLVVSTSIVEQLRRTTYSLDTPWSGSLITSFFLLINKIRIFDDLCLDRSWLHSCSTVKRLFNQHQSELIKNENLSLSIISQMTNRINLFGLRMTSALFLLLESLERNRFFFI